MQKQYTKADVEALCAIAVAAAMKARELRAEHADANTICRTCKQWHPPDSESVGEVPGIGTCKATPQYWVAAEWTEDGVTRKLKPQFANSLALVEDGSGYRAALRTFPDFGCVQHEMQQDAQHVNCAG
jgi:hypothetical protein